MKIAIISFNNAVMTSVYGSYEIFAQVNMLLSTFRPDLPNPSLYPEIVDANKLDTKTSFDMVILPAMHFHAIEEVIASNAHLIEWLKKHHEKGGEIASICLGAFLLASTGLINYKIATTHWMGAEKFKLMFPNVDLVDDKIVTEQNRIYCSGGAYSFTTLIIYLIEKIFGEEAAILIAKVFLIHLHDGKQDSFKILNLQKSHNNEKIKIAQNFIEHNYHKKITLEELSTMSNMSLRNFMRVFNKTTGDTPNAYIQKVRVEKAKKTLECSNLTFEQICLNVGYTDYASFRRLFKKKVGQTPSEYRKKYQRIFTEANSALKY